MALLSAGSTADALKELLALPDRPAGLDAHETQAATSLVGQVRTSLSAWLWLRTDLYLHNWVEMRPLSDGERRQGRSVEGAANDGHDQIMREANVTVVPAQADDFRGILGDLERETAAYKDMHGHSHNDPTAALPLFRLMTWVDPKFVPGWTTGAAVLARDRNPEGARQALKFLSSGLLANADNIEILSSIGYVEITRRNDLETAARYLERARAAGRVGRGKLDEDADSALQQTYRWLSLCYRNLGRFDQQLAVAQEGLGMYADDAVLARLADEPPLIIAAPKQAKGSSPPSAP
ncbi:MAG: hypothetical protein HYR64_04580 [Fimbriimonas ginsengisoli]|uniref:Tetratricopeptide repeat protein n=1 Tax=Fimbriimonas ginsengisoli TaxID=1005039 RepID=A0A931LVB1_FIMGI|nr:hypothetical protein [Fimbriimonas ginsengisoli]MBI3743150.1 hypothetical protein [Chloroflexota bacterium]